MISKIREKIRIASLTYQYNKISGQMRLKPESVLIILGDPRGGTTWLAELVKQIPLTAMVWEPLSVSQVKEVKALGFQWRQYIPEMASWREAKDLFTRIFAGQLLSPYLCQTTSPGEMRSAGHLLVKFCRANQILPWLTRTFSFELAPIYLVRHPCAVVASQLKQGGWSHVKPNFEMPTGRYEDFYTNHADFLCSVDVIEKRLAAIWCLCNQVPLNHLKNNKHWITLTYESLLLDGPAQLTRIEKRWNMQFSDETYRKLAQASSTSVPGSPIQQGNVNEQLAYWKTQLSTKQIDNILSVLDYFKIDLYNTSELPARGFGD
jgi:Sulfotransferase domain